MIFQWLGMTSDLITVIRIVFSLFSFGALILAVVFYVIYVKNVLTNFRLAKSYMRASAMSGIIMGIFGLLGIGSMWYLDLGIIVINSFTYYANRD